MKLIPVIDLQGGVVVAARLGQRHAYAPLVSPLCPGSSALAEVTAALLALYPFDTLYIADLDAIGGGPAELDRIAALGRAHPGLRLWVDNGLRDLDRLATVARPVIGSESLTSREHLVELRTRHPDAVLSLDYRGDRFVGPAGLDRRPGLWPAEVILMTLARVGSGAGPDLARLAAARRRAPGHRIHAAGGVRDLADLTRLSALGVAGALVATALHQGRLSAAEIRAVSGSAAEQRA